MERYDRLHPETKPMFKKQKKTTVYQIVSSKV